MPLSKAELVRDLINRAVYDAIAARALEYPQHAEVLKRHAINLRNDAAYRITCDKYRMKELADIMAWKKGPRV